MEASHDGCYNYNDALYSVVRRNTYGCDYKLPLIRNTSMMNCLMQDGRAWSPRSLENCYYRSSSKETFTRLTGKRHPADFTYANIGESI